MPNHITNRITAEDPATLAAIATALRGGGDALVDFNRLVPMPADIFRGDLSMEKREETAGRNWLDWSRARWGTKWNAYAIQVDDAAVQFQTAWSCPEPIVYALAVAVKGPWTWQYADEDIGRNCGIWSCDEAGSLTPAYPEPHTEGAQRFACAIVGYDYDEYRAEQGADGAEPGGANYD